MTLPGRIQQHLASNPLNEDGEPFDTKLLPGMTEDELLRLEAELGFSLPAPTRDLLRFTRGMENGPMEIIDFVGYPSKWYYIFSGNRTYREISPDGFGNSWFYDFDKSSSDLGPIYYYQHEGPMVFYQCASIVEFVEECLRFMTPPYESMIDNVHEFRPKPLKQLHDDLIPHETALRNSDPVLSAYAASLGEDVLFHDFRHAQPGDGFDLRRYEAVGRHPDVPIYALRQRVGLIQKIWSLLKRS